MIKCIKSHYNSLPDNFNRQSAIGVCKNLKIKIDYLDKILKMKNYFKKTSRSNYTKVKSSAESAVL